MASTCARGTTNNYHALGEPGDYAYPVEGARDCDIRDNRGTDDDRRGSGCAGRQAFVSPFAGQVKNRFAGQFLSLHLEKFGDNAVGQHHATIGQADSVRMILKHTELGHAVDLLPEDRAHGCTMPHLEGCLVHSGI